MTPEVVGFRTVNFEISQLTHQIAMIAMICPLPLLGCAHMGLPLGYNQSKPIRWVIDLPFPTVLPGPPQRWLPATRVNLRHCARAHGLLAEVTGPRTAEFRACHGLSMKVVADIS